MRARQFRSNKKQQIPSKICKYCGRSFTWRKKWERDWEHVKYCSKRCSTTQNTIKG